MTQTGPLDIKIQEAISLLKYFREHQEGRNKNQAKENFQNQLKSFEKQLHKLMINLMNDAYESICQKIQSVEKIVQSMARSQKEQNKSFKKIQQKNQENCYSSILNFSQKQKLPNQKNISRNKNQKKAREGQQMIQNKKSRFKYSNCHQQFKQYSNEKINQKNQKKQKQIRQNQLQYKQQKKYQQKSTNVESITITDNDFQNNQIENQQEIKFQEDSKNILKNIDLQQKSTSDNKIKKIKIKKIEQVKQEIKPLKLNFKISSLLTLEQKQFIQERLVKTGVKYTNKSELLFKFSDHSFSKNFHQYIDYKNNLLLVVKLTNKKVLCGFTQISFQKRNIPEENYRAFICDVTRRKIYLPKNPCKTICYDQNFIIFGNSQIRLKNKDFKVYSNFGISKSFFLPDGDQVGDFLGKQGLISKRQAEIEDYEIYSLS